MELQEPELEKPSSRRISSTMCSALEGEEESYHGSVTFHVDTVGMGFLQSRFPIQQDPLCNG